MKIVLFGAGNDGLSALEEFGENNIYCFADQYKEGTIGNIPIKKIENLIPEKDSILIVITSSKYQQELIDIVNKMSFPHCQIFHRRATPTQNKKRLSSKKWMNIYNTSLLENIINAVTNDTVSVWSKELLRITKIEQKILEIGCGSGMTSLYLAKHNRKVTAIDYQENSLKLIEKAAKRLGYCIDEKLCDATQKLPFKEKYFDIAFQAGLLEHFTKGQRITLLKLWKPVCETMVSMIPNANSLAYRVGKKILEHNGTWQYGLELPQATLLEEFYAAGYTQITEYTIGINESLTFLPENHYLRIALEKCINNDLFKEDLYGQGYLLVTIGKNL